MARVRAYFFFLAALVLGATAAVFYAIRALQGMWTVTIPPEFIIISAFALTTLISAFVMFEIREVWISFCEDLARGRRHHQR